MCAMGSRGGKHPPDKGGAEGDAEEEHGPQQAGSSMGAQLASAASAASCASRGFLLSAVCCLLCARGRSLCRRLGWSSGRMAWQLSWSLLCMCSHALALRQVLLDHL